MWEVELVRFYRCRVLVRLVSISSCKKFTVGGGIVVMAIALQQIVVHFSLWSIDPTIPTLTDS